MAGGGLGSVLGLGASLVAPQIPALAPFFGEGADLGTRLLSNAVLGGGIAALTGGNPFLGALAGSAGAGIKGLMSGPQATYMGETGAPATQGVNISNANSPFGTIEPVSATSPFGTVGSAGIPNMDAAQLASIGSNITPQAIDQLGQQAAPPAQGVGVANAPTSRTTPGTLDNRPSPTGGVDQLSSAQATDKLDPAKVINQEGVRYSTLAIGKPDGPLPNGDYVLNEKLYKGTDIANAAQKSFFEKYKWPLIAGGAGLALLGTKQPKMNLVQPTVQGPQFGLAANYQRTPNPTPTYPTFYAAEGGLADLAQGGSLVNQPAKVDFMGGDMYPMSQQQRSFYATPTQMPTSAQQALASYEPKTNPLTGIPTANMAHGGIADLDMEAKGGMLKGPGDGMSDSIPGTIDGVRPARLADGEFVVPADVVSHLGNGSTDAGAKHLYSMMDRIRKARTGRKTQGRQINPAQYMPA